MEVGIQAEPRQEIGIGAFGCRRAEVEFIKVLHTLTDLTTDGQPDTLIGRERDKLQPVPEIVGLAQIHTLEHRPVLVEP